MNFPLFEMNLYIVLYYYYNFSYTFNFLQKQKRTKIFYKRFYIKGNIITRKPTREGVERIY